MAGYGELYGTPIGHLAYDENQRAELKSQLDAQRALGELSKIPYEIEHLKSQTAHQKSIAELQQEQAAKAREDAAQARRVQAIAAYTAAQRAAGREATVAGAEKIGNAAANPYGFLEDFVKNAEGVMPAKDLADILGKISSGKENEAQAASHKASEAATRGKAIEQAAENAGAWAQSAIRGPQEYMTAMQALLSNPETANNPGMKAILQSMPPVYGPQAKQRLQQIIDNAVSVKDKAAIDAKNREAAAAESRAESTRISALASANAANARAALTRERHSILSKEFGPNSPEAKEAKQVKNADRRQAMEARQLRYAPPIPTYDSLAGNKAYVGKIFTDMGSKKMLRFEGFDITQRSAKYPDGKPLLREVTMGQAAMQDPAARALLNDNGED